MVLLGVFLTEWFQLWRECRCFQVPQNADGLCYIPWPIPMGFSERYIFNLKKKSPSKNQRKPWIGVFIYQSHESLRVLNISAWYLSHPSRPHQGFFACGGTEKKTESTFEDVFLVNPRVFQHTVDGSEIWRENHMGCIKLWKSRGKTVNLSTGVRFLHHQQ